MGNGEIQPDKRVSHIKKGIQRTLSTAAYETIVIYDYIEEDIEWENLEERQRKLENWETLLLQSFKRYHDRALTELGLELKCAYIENRASKKIKPRPGQKTELDELLKDLEDLDTLETLDSNGN